MGFQGANTGINSLNGILDELRISDTARTADWIVTEYRNQNVPGSFYVIGPPESSAGRRR